MSDDGNKMDQDVYDLTEFGPVPESPESSFSWSNLFKWNRASKAPLQVSKSNVSSSPVVKGFHYSSKYGKVVEVEQVESPVVEEVRSVSKSSSTSEPEVAKRFSNVIKKISSALERSSSSNARYYDYDFKQYWMADSDCKECYDCGDKFTTFRRRHHCRICGQVFCSSCCNQEVPGKLLRSRVDLRVCVYCCKVFLSCIQTADLVDDSEIDFKTLQDQLKTRLGVMAASQNKSLKRKVSTAFNEFASSSSSSHGQPTSFPDKKVYDPAIVEERRFSIDNCADFGITMDEGNSCDNHVERVGNDEIEPLWVSRVNHKTGESLWDSTDESQYQDSEFFRSSLEAGNLLFTQSGVVFRDTDKIFKTENQRMFRSSYDNQQFALKDDAMRAGAFNASAVAAAEVASFCLTQKAVEFDAMKLEISHKLREIYEKYERQMIHQLLVRHDLPLSWSEVIISIVQQVVKSVKVNSDKHKGEMDIRPSVQIKKIAGGEYSDCIVVNGVVCSKNVAHKKMRSEIISPKILLIRSPIIYQRQENRFLSLEPALLQEMSYLRNIVAKIIALRPDVVLVENTVSRIAQDFFLEADITLVLNVKSSVMNRVARLTNANVLTSIDAHFARPQLGTCKMMSLNNYLLPDGSIKTLLKFDGCEPHLGCTILIRGASDGDLCKVKRIMKFMLFMNFNQKLELAFLSDEVSLPSPTGFVEFLNDSFDSLPYHLPDTSEIINSLNYNTVEPTSVEPKLSLTSVISEMVDDNSDLLLKSLEEKFTNLNEALTCIRLSISPSVNYVIPCYEKNSYLKYFPQLALHSVHLNESLDGTFDVENETANLFSYQQHLMPENEDFEPHPIMESQFNNSVYQYNIQSVLSHYRATGKCRIYHEDSELWLPNSRSVRWRSPESYNNTTKLDVLDPFNHQSLSVLFCSYSYKSSNSPYFCIDPWIVRMDYYGLNDITLGGFLEKYCFRTSYTCPSSTCDAQMIDHIRRFVHSEGCVYILLHKLDAPLAACVADQFLVWSWCRKCKVSSKLSIMSTGARSLSFAKYLELRFHNHNYIDIDRSVEGLCQHSLHRDHYQYFACKDIIAAFKYSPVSLYELQLPREVLVKLAKCNNRFGLSKVSEESLVDVIRSLAVSGHGIYDTVLEKLQDLSSDLPVGKAELFSEKISHLQYEKNQFREKVKEIQIKLAASEDNELLQQNDHKEFWEVVDNIVMLKRHLVEAVISWNNRLTECVQVRRKDEKVTKQLVIKSVISSSAVDQQHHESDLSLISSVKTNDGSSSATSESVEDDKDLQGLDEPLYEYFGDVSTNDGLQTSDVGDRNSNQSFDLCDGKSLPVEAPPSDKESGLDTPRNEKKSSMLVKSMLSQLLSLPSAVNLPMPFPQNEHHMLPHCEKVPIVVYEDEPSSIIAYALSSADYELGIQNLLSQPESKFTSLKDSKDLNFSSARQKSTRSEKRSELTSGDKSDVYKENPEIGEKTKSHFHHLEVQFADSTTKFTVEVCFAKQFLRLREKILPEGEEAFIRSLSRCCEWHANGGKSGCLFCKTHDDRFILKQMGRLEANQFLEFAPQYIEYILEATEKKKPTAMVKILGAFRILCRLVNHSNPHIKMDLLVMENLFYGREIDKAFDLKGSIRNRLVDINGKDSSVVVLQDENLLKMACDYPLYVRQHSKMILSYAIQNDTQFLSDHSVMDYSLLVGVDEKNKELIVGIIDYIRTFTWDKRLENLVKSSGILGGQGRLPTVVSPELYRNRFCEAMDRYILLVPDQWSEITSMDL